MPKGRIRGAFSSKRRTFSLCRDRYVKRSRSGAPGISQIQDMTSAASGRTFEEIRDENSGNGNAEETHSPIPRDLLEKLPFGDPKFVVPMQPQPVAELPAGDGWLCEAKFDGYRALLVKQRDTVRLLSRKGKSLNGKYSKILQAGMRMRCSSAVLDGEIIVIDENGRPSFQALQNFRDTTDSSRLFYYCFDLLQVSGRSTLALPLEQRRMLLQRLVNGTGLKFSEALEAAPEVLITSLRNLGIEGIVAKKLASTYQPGKRSAAWVKLKLNAEQEFVVGGYTRGQPFDALLVGYYDSGNLVFAGRVRGGLSRAARSRLFERIKGREAETCHFSNLPDTSKNHWGEGLTQADMDKVVWLEPDLVVQIGFVEWTRDNRLRHPSYKGIRDDKAAGEVRRE